MLGLQILQINWLIVVDRRDLHISAETAAMPTVMPISWSLLLLTAEKIVCVVLADRMC